METGVKTLVLYPLKEFGPEEIHAELEQADFPFSRGNCLFLPDHYRLDRLEERGHVFRQSASGVLLPDQEQICLRPGGRLEAVIEPDGVAYERRGGGYRTNLYFGSIRFIDGAP